MGKQFRFQSQKYSRCQQKNPVAYLAVNDGAGTEKRPSVDYGSGMNNEKDDDSSTTLAPKPSSIIATGNLVSILSFGKK
jgi:hypothetical protein